MTALRIQSMTRPDLATALDWAAAEGWNPGLDDVDAFHAVDPQGFLMGWLGDQPVACISVVRHTPGFGFLGFYICHPDHRGQGHGWALWQAGLAHLGARTVGLDGVPDQEENYRRSGFEPAFRSHRFEGEITARGDGSFVRAGPEDLRDLIDLDAAVHGVERGRYVRAWTASTDDRMTLLRRDDDGICAQGTIRTCRTGHKIGPLIAPDLDAAMRLIESLAAASGAVRIAIDVPDTSAFGHDIASQLGLESAFQCARMYKGPAPRMDMTRLIGLTSFELG